MSAADTRSGESDGLGPRHHHTYICLIPSAFGFVADIVSSSCPSVTCCSY